MHRGEDNPRKVSYTRLLGITQINRLTVVAGHQADESLDEVGDVLKGSCLLARPVHREATPLQRLADKVRYYASIVDVHPRSVGVEDSGDANLKAFLLGVGVRQRLRHPLSLVVAGARPDWVDVAPVRLRLRMDGRVAVDLTGGGDQNATGDPLCKAQHVDRSHGVRLDRLNRIEHVVRRTGRTGQVVDLIYLDVQRIDDVMVEELKVGVADPVGDVEAAACGGKEERLKEDFRLKTP